MELPKPAATVIEVVSIEVHGHSPIISIKACAYSISAVGRTLMSALLPSGMEEGRIPYKPFTLKTAGLKG